MSFVAGWSRTAGQRLTEILPQNNLFPRVAYAVRYGLQKRRRAAVRPGFSIVIATYNRVGFLQRAVEAILENTREPFELIIVDNASTDGTFDFCQALEQQRAPSNGTVRTLHLKRNIGTNAYAFGFLEATCDHLVCMDDDVLALSLGWDGAALRAYREIPRLGFLALNVIQDAYTDGAKKSADQYRSERRGSTVIEIGPVGAWFAITTRAIYDEVGGFIFRPYKAYILHDGKYIRRMQKNGYFAAILRDKCVYHAAGARWSAAYGYRKHWIQKYQRNYQALVGEVDAVSVEDKPTFDYAKRMVRERDSRPGQAAGDVP